MAKVVGSMTARGYIKDPQIMLDELFAYSLLAYKHQTDVYYGNIMSFDNLMKESGNKPHELAEKLTEGYMAFFGRHYPSVKGKVKANEPNDGTWDWTLTIAFTVHDQSNTAYQLNETIGYKDSKVMRILKTLGGTYEQIY